MGIGSILIIWAILRARSAHFLLDRVWRMVGGGPIKDPDLIKAWDTVRDLEGFRFKTGINFKTKESFSNTLAWLEKNEMTITNLSFVRGWIIDQPLTIKKPNKVQYKVLAWFISAAFIPLAILSTYIAVQPNVLLTVKSSSFTFWTDGTTASNFIFNGNNPAFSVTEHDCQSSIAHINEADKSVICSTLSPTNKAKISSSLMEQRLGAAYLIFICLVLIIPTARLSAKATIAEKFYLLLNPVH